MMALLSGAGALFGAMGWIGRLVTIGAILASLLGAYGVWHHKVYTSGYNAAIADIAKADAKAVAAATAARSAYLACKNDGRTWDTSTGTCGGK